jgi:hypothetical protein
MTTTRTAPLACPYCHAINDAATSLDTDPEPPREGDVTVCFYCASILLFTRDDDDQLAMRKPNDAELHELRRESNVASFRAHLLKFAREQGIELRQVKP